MSIEEAEEAVCKTMPIKPLVINDLHLATFPTKPADVS